MKRIPVAVLIVAVTLGTTVVSGQVQKRLLGIGSDAPKAAAFFSDAALQEIRLTISSRDWQALKDDYLENTYYPADFRWRDQVVRNVGIRSRGTGSRSPVKPGLRVDFNRYSTDQTFLGLSSVVLRNNTQDGSNMHERLSMLLFERMGVPASREAFTKLYINDEYAGLYTIVESVDKSFLGRTFGENGGYLYNYEYPPPLEGENPFHFEYRGSDPGLYVPSPFKPETHTNDPRPEFIEQLLWTINQMGSASFRTSMADYLSLEKFVREIAVENFVADNDCLLGDYGPNNFFLYRFENQTLFTFIPWDKSEAFKGGSDYSIFHNIKDTYSGIRNRLVDAVLLYPDLYDLYLDTLLECVRSAAEPASGMAGGPGWLEGEIQREYQQIHEAALADPVKPFPNDVFEGSVGELLAFAQQRGDAVTQQVAAQRSAATSRLRRRLRE